MTYLISFCIAVALLTRIPVPARAFECEISSATRSQSVIFYPLVGLLAALLLTATASILSLIFSGEVLASLILLLWISVTGAIHLDGLADAVDAIFAGHKHPDKIREVMKDPHIGVMGVVSLVLLLIIKYSALTTLLTLGNLTSAIVLAMVLSRQLAVIYMLHTPYVSVEGMASDLDTWRYRSVIYSLAALILFVAIIIFSLVIALAMALTLLLLILVWRTFWIKTIGGYTGDCVGALIEITECLVLTVLVVFTT